MSMSTTPSEDKLNYEYDMLREEILRGMSLRNTLLTFMITTTIAILSFALTEKSVVISVLAFCAIFPMSRRIVDNYDGMARVSAYMMVFLEQNMTFRKWETRLYDTDGNPKRVRYAEGMILSFVTYAVFLILYHEIGIPTWYDKVHCVLPIVYILYEIKLAYQTYLFHEMQEKWKDKWDTIKEMEAEVLNQSDKEPTTV